MSVTTLKTGDRVWWAGDRCYRAPAGYRGTVVRVYRDGARAEVRLAYKPHPLILPVAALRAV